jgi:hypothetical protein
VDAKAFRSRAGRQLEELSRSLVEARQKRAEAESAYQQVQQARAGKRRSKRFRPFEAPLVQKMKEQEGMPSGSTATRPSDMARASTADSSKGEMESARENTRRQIESVVAGVSKEYEIAKANEAAVERALAKASMTFSR